MQTAVTMTCALSATVSMPHTCYLVGPCRLETSVTHTSQTMKLRLREAEKPVQGHDPTDRSRPAFPRGAH